MMQRRQVLPEALDHLDAQDPAAQHSRRDLQRLHRLMGTQGTVLRFMRALPISRRSRPPLRVLELGAGDGSLMLGVARALHGTWPAVAITLLDRQPLLAAATVDAYAEVGWAARAEIVDVLDWAAFADARHWDLVVAHLFLHHFQAAQVAALLAAVAARSDHFLACEPRRGWIAWAGSHLVGALGANAITRSDAVLSVRAGFRDGELRALWPATGWTLAESGAGLFSHCLTASRTPPPRDTRPRQPLAKPQPLPTGDHP